MTSAERSPIGSRDLHTAELERLSERFEHALQLRQFVEEQHAAVRGQFVGSHAPPPPTSATSDAVMRRAKGPLPEEAQPGAVPTE
jgi:hypothetical protein